MEVQKTGLRSDGRGIPQLDTVRALHQTVVSLRNALEESQLELNNLKQKYESHIDSSIYSETIEKLTLENNILKKKLNKTDSKFVGDNHCMSDEKQLKSVTFNLGPESDLNNSELDSVNTTNVLIKPKEINNSLKRSPLVVFEDITDNLKTNKKISIQDCSDKENDNVNEICETNDSIITVIENNKIDINKLGDKKNINLTNDKNINSEHETKIELESKFDLTIKVLTTGDNKIIPIELTSTDSNVINIKSNNSLSTLNNNSNNKEIHNNKNLETVNINVPLNEKIKMAGSKEITNLINKCTDKFNIQLKITSEENLILNQNIENDNIAENLNVETDEISARSISEGDNSVFSEAGGTITETTEGRRMCEQDSVSGNDSEEVDDIELIFTTDETKEFTSYQEDLVSIIDGENWAHGDNFTPIIVKFNMLDSENQLQRTLKSIVNIESDSFQHKIQDITQQNSTDESYIIDQVKIQSDENQILDKVSNKYKRGLFSNNSQRDKSDSINNKNFESNDSLNLENQKSYSFDTTKSSSLDRGSSIDMLSRDLSFDQKESLDQLNALRSKKRTHHSILVETDISKCGIVEDDIFPGNLNLRRNTCPNPFQYRPFSHRDAVKGFISRPLLGPTSKTPRKSSAAQTDISALPNHWRSDTHLAKKILPCGLTTLPGKLIPMGKNITRHTPSIPLRPTQLSEESRRVLLSDIGFTSMVPELSRSAEPIWGALNASTSSASINHLSICCTQHATPYYGSVPSSPTRQDSSVTDSKYWSKSSIQRSVSGKMGELTPGIHRVSFIDQPTRSSWHGSMPELRKNVICCGRPNHCFNKSKHFCGTYKCRNIDGDDGDSTEELLDEADQFLRRSVDFVTINKSSQSTIKDDTYITQYSKPYLPSNPRQLRLGHIVKVIAPYGRIALGKVRYVGIAGGPTTSGSSPIIYVGIQLKNKVNSGGDGTFQGRRYFNCEYGYSLFVPFSKVIVAWSEVK